MEPHRSRWSLHRFPGQGHRGPQRAPEVPSATIAPGQHRFVLVNSDPPTRSRVRGRHQPAAAPADQARSVRSAWALLQRQRLPGALASEGLATDLRSSRGIVFLYDPTREHAVGDAFIHLDGPLNHLLSWAYHHGGLLGGKLPHHIAICVTKFDEEKVLRSAHQLGMLEESMSEDGRDQPRVSDMDAREFFARLCDVSRNENADLMLKSLNRYFWESRIRYFVTSSIGFYIRGHRFDYDDFVNVRTQRGPGGSEVQFIRGQARPINVLEPLLWLGEQIAVHSGEGRS